MSTVAVNGYPSITSGDVYKAIMVPVNATIEVAKKIIAFVIGVFTAIAEIIIPKKQPIPAEIPKSDSFLSNIGRLVSPSSTKAGEA